jgi:maleamate amidohydrolase
MELSNKTARQMYEEIKANPRHRFGFGRKPMIINVDVQKSFTLEDEYPSAYTTHPKQIDYINEISDLARSKNLPVIWTYVAYRDDAADCGIWGTRSQGEHALQNIKVGSRKSELDDRLRVDPKRDVIINKRGASAFFQTNVPSLAVWYRTDTCIVTGGSTSGCVRATVVDSLQSGFRTIVPEECTSDRHESPHFANLYDMAAKYADVIPAQEVIDYLTDYMPSND